MTRTLPFPKPYVGHIVHISKRWEMDVTNLALALDECRSRGSGRRKTVPHKERIRLFNHLFEDHSRALDMAFDCAMEYVPTLMVKRAHKEGLAIYALTDNSPIAGE